MAKYKVGDHVRTGYSKYPLKIIQVTEREGEDEPYRGRDIDGLTYDFGDDAVRELTVDDIGESVKAWASEPPLEYKVGDQVYTTISNLPTTVVGVNEVSGRPAKYEGRDADGWEFYFRDDDVREITVGMMDASAITVTSEPITEESLNFTPTDTVNHPPHYNFGDIEVIDYIKQVTETYDGGFTAYCIGNVLKYISRAQHKGNPAEDLRKAEWYLRKAIENETE